MMTDCKVLVISQFFWPEPNFITADVARALRSFGPAVVITGFPNYPEGRFAPGSRPWLPKKEEVDGLTVWRVPYFPDRSHSALRRFVCYTSFVLSAWCAALFVGRGAGLVWVYQTPPIAGVIAAFMRMCFNSKVVFTYADLWPESFLASGVSQSKRAAAGLRWIRRLVNRAADLIICSTEGTLKILRDEGAQARLVHIPVWVDGIPLGSLPPIRNDSVHRFVYAGNIGPCQDLDCIIEAADILRMRDDIRFDFYGSGSEQSRLEANAAERGLANIGFHGRVSAVDAFRHSQSATGQIVTLKRGPLFANTVPSKLAFCFAAATPVLYSLEGEAASVAEDSGGARAFDGRDARTLVKAVTDLIEVEEHVRGEMCLALRLTYERYFQPSVLLGRYVQEVGAVVAPGSRRARPSPARTSAIG